MDLAAYVQIEDLGQLAEDNGIEVPRLRGYRLMKDESPISEQEISETIKDCEIYVAKSLCEARPFWSPGPEYRTWDAYSDYLNNFFLEKDSDGKYASIRWDRIHGWKRKVLKFEIKKQARKVRQQYDTWNKYAGMDGVLYIHSRMGGNNWKCFDLMEKIELVRQPWFLDRVDDWLDSTYCDFYAKLNTVAQEGENE